MSAGDGVDAADAVAAVAGRVAAAFDAGWAEGERLEREQAEQEQRLSREWFARAAAVTREPGPRPLVVVLTMAAKGTICGDCTHPFGRHEFVAGCVSPVVGSDFRCGCLARPVAAAAVAAA